jgi:hypothetical protein
MIKGQIMLDDSSTSSEELCVRYERTCDGCEVMKV